MPAEIKPDMSCVPYRRAEYGFEEQDIEIQDERSFPDVFRDA